LFYWRRLVRPIVRQRNWAPVNGDWVSVASAFRDHWYWIGNGRGGANPLSLGPLRHCAVGVDSWPAAERLRWNSRETDGQWTQSGRLSRLYEALPRRNRPNDAPSELGADRWKWMEALMAGRRRQQKLRRWPKTANEWRTWSAFRLNESH